RVFTVECVSARPVMLLISDLVSSIKIPKYQYVALDFVSWVRCGKRRGGGWIGGSSGRASPGDCAAGWYGAAATFAGGFSVSDRAHEPCPPGPGPSFLFAVPLRLCRR